jgi:putative NADH-flavin reductase
MKLLLIGASGMIGSRIGTEAGNRGHDVTGVTRTGADGAVRADATQDSIAEVIRGHDAVVLAVSAPRDGSPATAPLLAAGRAVLDGMRLAGVERIVVVGGAGSLEVSPGMRLVDSPGFPDAYKAEALAQTELLELVRTHAADLRWTYVSPAAVIEPGDRTAAYRIGGDQLLADAAGASAISVEDYAVAIVDELEREDAVGRQISVAY